MDPISAAHVSGQFDVISFERDRDNVHRSVTVPTRQDTHRSFPEPRGKYHVHRVLAMLSRMTSGFPAQRSFLGPW